MIETNYKFKNSAEKTIEKIISDDNLLLNHMLLPKGTGLPKHFSNSNVYMIIIKGTMSMKLGEQEEEKYSKGDIINIPYNIQMDINNVDDEILEFFVVKAPNPKDFPGE